MKLYETIWNYDDDDDHSICKGDAPQWDAHPTGRPLAPAEVVLSMLRRALPSTKRLVGRTFSTAEQAIAYVGHHRSKISRLLGNESQKKKGRSFWTSRVRIPMMRSWNPANLGRLHGRRNGRDDCSLAGLNAGCAIVRINFNRQGVLRYWCQW